MPLQVPLTDSGAIKATNVVEALARVIRDLPSIGKDERAAPQQGGYAYRGIDAITRAAQPLLAREGIVFAPRVTEWRPTREIIVNNKPWTDESMLVTYRVYGPGGIEDYIEVTTPAIGRDNSDKGANKCMTQAFKYALIQVLCISDETDDGDRASHEADARPAADVAPVPWPVDEELIAEVKATVQTLPEERKQEFMDWAVDAGFQTPWSVETCRLMREQMTSMIQADAIDLAATPCALCGSTRSRRVLGAGDVVRCSETKGCEERQAALEAPFSEATT